MAVEPGSAQGHSFSHHVLESARVAFPERPELHSSVPSGGLEETAAFAESLFEACYPVLRRLAFSGLDANLLADVFWAAKGRRFEEVWDANRRFVAVAPTLCGHHEAEAEGGGPTWDRRRQAAPPQPPVPLPNRLCLCLHGQRHFILSECAMRSSRPTQRRCLCGTT
jgi:hypothetical protein